MAWKAFIERVTKEEKDLVVIVTYTDNVKQKFQADYHFQRSDRNALYSLIKTKLAELNSIDTAGDDIPQGEFTPDPDPQPTPKQIFSVELAKLRSFKRLVDDRVIEQDNADYAIQLAAVQALFKIEYIDVI